MLNDELLKAVRKNLVSWRMDETNKNTKGGGDEEDDDGRGSGDDDDDDDAFMSPFAYALFKPSTQSAFKPLASTTTSITTTSSSTTSITTTTSSSAPLPPKPQVPMNEIRDRPSRQHEQLATLTSNKNNNNNQINTSKETKESSRMFLSQEERGRLDKGWKDKKVIMDELLLWREEVEKGEMRKEGVGRGEVGRDPLCDDVGGSTFGKAPKQALKPPSHAPILPIIPQQCHSGVGGFTETSMGNNNSNNNNCSNNNNSSNNNKHRNENNNNMNKNAKASNNSSNVDACNKKTFQLDHGNYINDYNPNNYNINNYNPNDYNPNNNNLNNYNITNIPNSASVVEPFPLERALDSNFFSCSYNLTKSFDQTHRNAIQPSVNQPGNPPIHSSTPSLTGVHPLQPLSTFKPKTPQALPNQSMNQPTYPPTCQPNQPNQPINQSTKQATYPPTNQSTKYVTVIDINPSDDSCSDQLQSSTVIML